MRMQLNGEQVVKVTFELCFWSTMVIAFNLEAQNENYFIVQMKKLKIEAKKLIFNNF
jgi:hypothetical protein